MGIFTLFKIAKRVAKNYGPNSTYKVGDNSNLGKKDSDWKKRTDNNWTRQNTPSIKESNITTLNALVKPKTKSMNTAMSNLLSSPFLAKTDVVKKRKDDVGTPKGNFNVGGHDNVKPKLIGLPTKKPRSLMKNKTNAGVDFSIRSASFMKSGGHDRVDGGKLAVSQKRKDDVGTPLGSFNTRGADRADKISDRAKRARPSSVRKDDVGVPLGSFLNSAGHDRKDKNAIFGRSKHPKFFNPSQNVTDKVNAKPKSLKTYIQQDNSLMAKITSYFGIKPKTSTTQPRLATGDPSITTASTNYKQPTEVRKVNKDFTAGKTKDYVAEALADNNLNIKHRTVGSNISMLKQTTATRKKNSKYKNYR